MPRTAALSRRRGGFTSNAQRMIAVCVVGALLLSSGSAFANSVQGGLLRRSLNAVVDEAITGTVTRCTGKAAQVSVEEPAPIPVTVSENQLSTTLVCVDTEVKEVPTNLTKVCVTKKGATVKSCASQQSDTITMKALLGESSSATWAPKTASNAPEKTWSLQLTAADLPLTDKTFFVGCQKSADQEATCKVDVTIKARTSKVDGNVVTCAYGSDSNLKPLEAEMTQEQNTLTVACGKDGTITPKAYDAYYCEDATLKPCAKSYKDILPAFQETWWKQEGGENAPLKLTIPKEGFPAEDKTFYVGCSPTSTTDPEKVSRGGEGETDATPAIKGPTACKVMVTVKAGSASLAASATETEMISVVFGIAALTGFFVGSA